MTQALAIARSWKDQPPLVSVAEAAVLQGITPAAMRQRAQRGEHGAAKIGDAGWAFPRALVVRS